MIYPGTLLGWAFPQSKLRRAQYLRKNNMAGAFMRLCAGRTSASRRDVRRGRSRPEGPHAAAQ